jgi:hypothetical protein
MASIFKTYHYPADIQFDSDTGGAGEKETDVEL